MPVNIEIKARVGDLHERINLARRLCDQPEKVLEQHDVFFEVPNGMLKLRRINGEQAELIAYAREPGDQPRPSAYEIVNVTDFDSMRKLLGAALGEVAEVRKTRTLFMNGRTRIHLDQVEGLGDFLELEVVLGSGDDEGSGRAEAERLMSELGVEQGDLLDRTYAEMLGGSSC